MDDNSGGILGSITSGIMSKGSSDNTPAPTPTPAPDVTPTLQDSTTTSPTKTGAQQAGGVLKAFQKGEQSGFNAPSAPIQQPSAIIPGSTYNALFASQTTPGMSGGGQIGVQSPNQIQQVQPIQAPQMQMAPQIQPTVSDIRAKFHIQKAEKEMDDFLTRVYSNILNKRGNR